MTHAPSPLVRGQGVVHVSYHQFLIIIDQESPQVSAPTGHNGLIAPLDHGAATIFTGISQGSVGITVESFASAPPADLDNWEEVAEISVEAEPVPQDLSPVPFEDRRAEMNITSLLSDQPDLPVLNPGGPGPYRVRVSANRRGHNWDGVDEEPVEEYLIQVWPEP